MAEFISAESARLWVERVLALALLLQSIEYVQLRRSFADDGVWSWSALKREHATLFTPLRVCFAAVLPYRPFLFLLGARALLSVLLGLGFGVSALLLFCMQLFINVRFRGTFNGGSDSMTILVLLALALSAPFGPESFANVACLYYVAVQATLSYFLAGVAKLKEAGWRSGATLSAFLNAGLYVVPDWARRAVVSSVRARAFALGVIAFECCFPLALLRRGVRRIFVRRVAPSCRERLGARPEPVSVRLGSNLPGNLVHGSTARRDDVPLTYVAKPLQFAPSTARARCRTVSLRPASQRGCVSALLYGETASQ